MAKEEVEKTESAAEVLTKANKKLARANKKLAEANEKLQEPKGIRSARAKPGEKLKRPDDVMKMDEEKIGDKTPDELTDNERVALERQIRKYVKQGGLNRNGDQVKGGFRKGLKPEQYEKAKLYLTRIGRPLKKGDTPAWDESIIVPGFGAKLR